LSYASPSVETVLGYRATEVLGESVLTYLHPDEELAGRAMLDRVVAGDAMAQADSLQVRVRHRDGSYRVLSCRQRNCLDIARIAGIVINARDITQEVLAQRLREDRLSCAARQREALFQLATSEDLDSSAQIDRS
jgi:PAS domain S-box-containing protein